MTNGDQPAFPCEKLSPGSQSERDQLKGITKRELLTGMIASGMIVHGVPHDDVASRARSVADQILHDS